MAADNPAAASLPANSRRDIRRATYSSRQCLMVRFTFRGSSPRIESASSSQTRIGKRVTGGLAAPRVSAVGRSKRGYSFEFDVQTGGEPTIPQCRCHAPSGAAQDHFFVPTGHECAGIAKTLFLGSRASCPRARARPQSRNRSPAAKVRKRTPNGDFGMALRSCPRLMPSRRSVGAGWLDRRRTWPGRIPSAGSIAGVNRPTVPRFDCWTRAHVSKRGRCLPTCGGAAAQATGHDELRAGPQVSEVQIAQDFGVGDRRETAPRVGAHRDTEALRLGADRTVEDDGARVGEPFGDVSRDRASSGGVGACAQ